MKLLVPLASLLGLEVDALVKRLREDALLVGVLALLGAITLVFALVAVHAALLPRLGPIWAPTAIAGASLLLALIVYAVARLSRGSRRRRVEEKRHASEARALVTTAAITAAPMLLKSPLIRKVGLPIGGAIAALYFLSRNNGSDDGDA